MRKGLEKMQKYEQLLNAYLVKFSFLNVPNEKGKCDQVSSVSTA